MLIHVHVVDDDDGADAGLFLCRADGGLFLCRAHADQAAAPHTGPPAYVPGISGPVSSRAAYFPHAARLGPRYSWAFASLLSSPGRSRLPRFAP